MAVKKEQLNLTYDALAFKVFMDSGETSFYGKEIYIVPGLAGNKDIFMQLLGNVGGYARLNDFDKDIDVVIFPDSVMNRLKEGYKDEFIRTLEDLINNNNTPYRKLWFTTEERVIDFMKTRANGRIRQNKKDLKDKNNSEDLNQRILDSIDVDESMLDMIKRYLESTKEPRQQELF